MKPIYLPQMPESTPNMVEMTTGQLLKELILHVGAQRGVGGVPKRIMALVGAEGGEPPAGVFQSSDAIAVVPGTGRTVDGQELSDIWQELQTWLAAFNTQADALVALLTFEVEVERVRIGQYTNPGFQDATEFGQPSKINLQYVFRGFPLVHKDLGLGFTREFLDRERGSEILAARVTAEAAWRQLGKEHTLNALFRSTNFTSRDGVAVNSLYNGDTEVPPPYKRSVFVAPHNHYLITAAPGTHDAADMQTLIDSIMEHGYGDFGESIVILQNRTEMRITRGLAEFVPAQTASVVQTTPGPIVGVFPGAGGMVAQGYIDRATFIEVLDVPAGYHLGWATGGNFSSQNPVGFRVHENTSARGLRLTPGPTGEYPITDAVYDGYVGAGVRHRGAAAVMQTSAGYVDPTFQL